MQSEKICDYCDHYGCKEKVKYEIGCAFYDEFYGVEVEPVRREKWIVRADGHYHCTGCDEEAHWVWTRDKQILSKYCPNCGAKMGGGKL